MASVAKDHSAQFIAKPLRFLWVGGVAETLCKFEKLLLLTLLSLDTVFDEFHQHSVGTELTCFCQVANLCRNVCWEAEALKGTNNFGHTLKEQGTRSGDKSGSEVNFARVIIVKILSFVGEWLQSDGTDEAEDAIVDLKKRWRNPDFEWLLTASAMTTATPPLSSAVRLASQ